MGLVPDLPTPPLPCEEVCKQAAAGAQEKALEKGSSAVYIPACLLNSIRGQLHASLHLSQSSECASHIAAPDAPHLRQPENIIS